MTSFGPDPITLAEANANLAAPLAPDEDDNHRIASALHAAAFAENLPREIRLAALNRVEVDIYGMDPVADDELEAYLEALRDELFG